MADSSLAPFRFGGSGRRSTLADIMQRRGGDGMFGYQVRPQLFPGEDDYFRANPHVTGMAAETDDIILNPYAPSSVNRDAVARNEAFRLLLRHRGMTPGFPVSEQQRKAFRGTPYDNNETGLRETLAARIYSMDPSAMATPEQEEWVRHFLMQARQR